MSIFGKIKNFFANLFRKQKAVPEKEIARIYCNVIFRDPFGDHHLTHQIDRIIINKNGIFVIEDKDWVGEIYGFAEDDFWRQVKRKGNRRYEKTHRNPIKQNEVHASVLEKVLLDEFNVVPYVVLNFNNANNINDEYVINATQLDEKLNEKTNDPLTEEEIEWICKKIEEKDCSSFISEEEHVQNIKRKYK